MSRKLYGVKSVYVFHYWMNLEYNINGVGFVEDGEIEITVYNGNKTARIRQSNPIARTNGEPVKWFPLVSRDRPIIELFLEKQATIELENAVFGTETNST